VTATPTATPIGGPPPAALRFDGATNYVEAPDSPSLRVPTNLTLEAWVKPTSAPGWRDVVGKHNYELAVQPNGAGFEAIFAFSTNFGAWRHVSSGSLPLDQWYHLAGTYDGATMRLFVNGALAASAPASGSVDQTNHPFRIGSADGHNDLFPGTVDEVRLSSVVRYTASFTPSTARFAPDAGTRGLWHLDEGSGTVTADASGNGNHAAFVGSPVWTTDHP
jgi:hypothetical protein